MLGGASTSLSNLAEDTKRRPAEWVMNLVTGASPLAQIER
jgi:hypothetical protein